MSKFFTGLFGKTAIEFVEKAEEIFGSAVGSVTELLAEPATLFGIPLEFIVSVRRK